MFPEKAGSTGIMPKDLIRSKILNCEKQTRHVDVDSVQGSWIVNKHFENTEYKWSLKEIRVLLKRSVVNYNQEETCNRLEVTVTTTGSDHTCSCVLPPWFMIIYDISLVFIF